MLQEGEIKFNYKSSLEMNLLLEKYPSIPRSNEEYEEIKVEGRNGSLYINKGTFPDKILPFIFTLKSTNIHYDLERIETWLTEVEDNTLMYAREDRVYVVKKILFGDFEQEFRTFGNIEIKFICEPFLSDIYETEYIITKSGFYFYYSGTATANTFIRMYGNGNLQLTIDNSTILIRDVVEYVDIDGELMQIRDKNKQSKDLDTTGEFIELEKGDHTIEFSSNVTKVEFKYSTKYK